MKWGSLSVTRDCISHSKSQIFVIIPISAGHYVGQNYASFLSHCFSLQTCRSSTDPQQSVMLFVWFLCEIFPQDALQDESVNLVSATMPIACTSDTKRSVCCLRRIFCLRGQQLNRRPPEWPLHISKVKNAWEYFKFRHNWMTPISDPFKNDLLVWWTHWSVCDWLLSHWIRALRFPLHLERRN